jgi:hypothetical protein
VLPDSREDHASAQDLRDTLGFINGARDALGHEPLSRLPFEMAVAGDPLRCLIARALHCVVFTSGQLSFDHEEHALRVCTATGVRTDFGDRTTIAAPGCVTRVIDDFDADRAALWARARQAGAAYAPMLETDRSSAAASPAPEPRPACRRGNRQPAASTLDSRGNRHCAAPSTGRPAGDDAHHVGQSG